MNHHVNGSAYCFGMGLACLCVGLVMGCLSESKPTVSLDGQTQYTIIQASQATEPEKFAVRELTNFLQRVTGASFPVAEEPAAPANRKGIYVGWTRYAARQGIDAATLGEEEWIIRSVGKNLVITGGRPRGTLYAVYEFLERQVGCHWLDRDTEVIPLKPTLALDSLDVRGKPWFWRRDVHSPTGCADNDWMLLVRNKNYRYDFRGRGAFPPEGAFYMLDGSPRVNHSFSYFVNAKDWFSSHPEYFSLNAEGQRVPAYDGSGPGQLCLTHPDVRRLTLENLRKFIAKDREEARAKGCPPPRSYMIGQNDKYDAHCKCTNCQVIAKREGSESGPLLDFINFVAAGIEKDYPDVLIETFAYNLTEPPPKTIKPRHNVLIGWCDVYSKSDVLRPLSHPYNVGHFEEIKAWGKIAPHLGIGDDYWALFSYYGEFPLPWTMVQCVGPDLKLFADCGAESFFAEVGYYMEPGENFIALKYWLAYQLLVNPHQAMEPLIKIFMDGYYGAASPAMGEYLAYLMGRIDKDAQFMMARNAPHELKYLDLEFFVTAQRLFAEAQARAKPGSLEYCHVLRDRFIVDSALLYLWPWLDRTLPPDRVLPFDHEELVQRFEEGWRNYEKHWFNIYYTPGGIWHNGDGKRMDRIEALFRDPKLPEAFRSLPGRDVADFNWLTFSPISPRQKFVIDAEAAGGMAAEPAAMSAILAAEEGAGSGGPAADRQHTRSLQFGVTGGATVTLKGSEMPQDGKFHLYPLGRINIAKGTMVWALEGQKLGVVVDRLKVDNASSTNANTWNVYISLKAQGPTYAHGSTETNAVRMDRVLLVKAQHGEQGPH